MGMFFEEHVRIHIPYAYQPPCVTCLIVVKHLALCHTMLAVHATGAIRGLLPHRLPGLDL